MPKIRRLFHTVQWKFVIIYISLILIAMQIIGVYFTRTVEQSFVDNFSESLNYQADSLAINLEPYLSSETGREQEDEDEIAEFIQDFVTLNNAGVQIIDQNGVIVGGSESEKHLIGQKNVQLEVNRALLGSRASDIRSDSMTGQRMMVLAVPVESNDNQVIGAVYLWAPMTDMYSTVRRINSIFATGTVFALLLTVVLGVVLSRTITNPVKAVTEQATAMANGDFNRRVNIMSNDEIGQLGQAFNNMAIRLREALSQNEEERVKLASVLANMSDGVIATDWQGHIVVHNERAEAILHTEIQEGDNLLQVLPSLSPKLSWPLTEQRVVFCEVSAPDDDTVYYVRLTFTPYQRQEDYTGGVIAVVQDVTEQEKLEQQRKEFVANVSHELRTPLTTIKSYLEALDDGAMQDRELGPKFLDVTRRETDRMIRLVTDLLHMSRLDSKEASLRLQPMPIAPLLEEVATRFAIPIERKNIQLVLDLSAPLPDVWADRDQIRRVLDNLMSNAIKYTADEGGKITVRARQKDDRYVEVRIQDNGIGIPKKDLNRIFERFYRVDKARSRSMGGTGLGLSIAREIIRAHGGEIDMDSELHAGTTVTFTLPVREGEGPK
ncbi:MAG: cell wall metabolism sensor histidine kinase WalK [Novibacillus thermophilus]|jgi:two-component system sensor histidine kinase VicK